MTDVEWSGLRDAMPVPPWLKGRGGQPEGYAFFRRRRVAALLAELHDRLRGLVREDAGRGSGAALSAAIDTRSLRAAPTIPRSTSGWDGGKEVGGRKRHVMVDSLGLLLVVMVTAASVQDRDAAGPVSARIRARFRRIQLVRADGGYAGRLVIWAAEKLQPTLEIVKRSDDASGFVVLRDVGSWRGR
ncbi:transposase [Streptomyces mirabilis]|uniref:transposase n=1 Tax=Streptomyces mirabilis TaxID=68239 RepID=UPI00367A8863